MKSSIALFFIALVAISIVGVACSGPEKIQTTGQNQTDQAQAPVVQNAAGDAGTQLENSFMNSLPPEPTETTDDLSAIGSDLAVQ